MRQRPGRRAKAQAGFRYELVSIGRPSRTAVTCGADVRLPVMVRALRKDQSSRPVQKTAALPSSEVSRCARDVVAPWLSRFGNGLDPLTLTYMTDVPSATWPLGADHPLSGSHTLPK